MTIFCYIDISASMDDRDITDVMLCNAKTLHMAGLTEKFLPEPMNISEHFERFVVQVT